MIRMQKTATPEHARAEGIAIAQEMLTEARGMIQGVQVSAPFGRYPLAVEILSVLGTASEETQELEGTEVGNV